MEKHNYGKKVFGVMETYTEEGKAIGCSGALEVPLAFALNMVTDLQFNSIIIERQLDVKFLFFTQKEKATSYVESKVSTRH